MPTYEMPILLRIMSKPEIVSTLKRTAQAIFDKGGVIRKIESLGQKETPYKTSRHDLVHREANYFIFYFDAPPSRIADLTEEYARDIDIVRKRIYKQENEPSPPCSLADEIKPPAYRLEVQKMMEIAKKHQRSKFKYNSGLNYYPFQK